MLNELSIGQKREAERKVTSNIYMNERASLFIISVDRYIYFKREIKKQYQASNQARAKKLKIGTLAEGRCKSRFRLSI